MQNITILLLASLLICGCQKEEQPQGIAGTFRYALLQASDCEDPSSNYSLQFTDHDCITDSGIEFCQEGTMQFSSDGRVTSSLKMHRTFAGFGSTLRHNGSGTYILNGQRLTVCIHSCEDYEIIGGDLVGIAQVQGKCTGKIILSPIR